MTMSGSLNFAINLFQSGVCNGGVNMFAPNFALLSSTSCLLSPT